MPRTLELQRKQAQVGWFFLLPTLLVLACVGLYPLVRTFYVSFTDTRLASQNVPHFVGVQNYAKLVHDGDFWDSVGHTVLFTVASVSVELVLGLAIALLLQSAFRGRGVVRAAMLIPWALPTVVSAKIWNYMLVDNYGVVNDLLLNKLHLINAKIAWLARPGLAMASIVAVDVWKTTPFMTLVLLAGMQTIPIQLFEAAQVDGASRWQRLWAVTMPLLKPTILVALIFRTLDTLRVFDVIWILTRGQFATDSMATYNYRHMIDFRKLGYGSAVSVMIFALISIFVAAYVLILRPKDSQA